MWRFQVAEFFCLPFFSPFFLFLGIVAATVQEQEELRRKEQEQLERKEEDDEDEEDSDDAFMREYREKRLQELKEEQKESMRLSMMPTFGTLLTYSADRLADVDSEHPETFVIVHLFETHIKACSMLNSILSNIARKLAYTKFVKVFSFHLCFPLFCSKGDCV